MSCRPTGSDHPRLLVEDAVRRVRAAFQPLVWLRDGSVAGYEALARGPAGSSLESPVALFGAARSHGLLTQLESAMTRRSLQGAIEAGVSAPLTVFGNVEPEAMADPPEPATLATIEAALDAGVRIVMEVTERNLLADPYSLLGTLEAVRSRGWGVALDDVGIDPTSLTMLPVLAPDVVKLDMALVQGPLDGRADHIAGEVRSYCDRTGASMVCEGIETDEHEERALALGADLGQGWRYGRPGPLPAAVPGPSRPVPIRPPAATRTLTEWTFASRPSTPATIDSISVRLRHLVGSSAPRAVAMFIAAPHRRLLTAGHLAELGAFARLGAFTGLLAPGCESEPAPGVRGVDLAIDDRLVRGWLAVVVGGGVTLALVGRPVPGDGGLVDLVVVDRPDEVVPVVRHLLGRFGAPGTVPVPSLVEAGLRG